MPRTLHRQRKLRLRRSKLKDSLRRQRKLKKNSLRIKIYRRRSCKKRKSRGGIIKPTHWNNRNFCEVQGCGTKLVYGAATRHHCRTCGNTICDGCSRYLFEGSSYSLRVCSDCETRYSNDSAWHWEFEKQKGKWENTVFESIVDRMHNPAANTTN